MSGRDEQAAYTPKVQLVRDTGANMVYDGSNDVAMVNMRREAAAQGLTGVDAWVCTIACYTDTFKAAGTASTAPTWRWASCRSRRRTQR